MERNFGADFATAIESLPVDGWQGPVRSEFGLHLVEITARVPGRKGTSKKPAPRSSATCYTRAPRKRARRITRGCAPSTSCASKAPTTALQGRRMRRVAALLFILLVRAGAGGYLPSRLSRTSRSNTGVDRRSHIRNPVESARAGRPAPACAGAVARGHEEPHRAAGHVYRRRLRRAVAGFPGDGLVGQEIAIDGLNRGVSDVIVRLERQDGTSQIERLLPESPQFTVKAPTGTAEVAWSYLVLGVEHILGGVDHLLFVLALLLIVRGGKRILVTITAFTAAHSITLVAATVGWLHVPGPPVEAMIALSIVFVAAEIIQAARAAGPDRARALGGRIQFRPASWLWLCRRPRRSRVARKGDSRLRC